MADSTAIPQPEVVWVFDHGYWQPSRRLWLEVKEASWDDVILDEDFKKRLRSDYGEFLKSKKTYHRLGIPWKRGLIFLGPPGNGKTSALKAIMGEITVPSLYVRTLGEYLIIARSCDKLGRRHASRSAASPSVQGLVREAEEDGQAAAMVADDSSGFRSP